MTNSATNNTKIALLAEAIEDMIAVMIDNAGVPGDATEEDMQHRRQELINALSRFLQPALRVIGGGLSRQHDPGAPLRNRPKCQKCKMHTKCDDNNCKWWHAAVRATMPKPPPREPEAA